MRQKVFWVTFSMRQCGGWNKAQNTMYDVLFLGLRTKVIEKVN
jgi:hypothetical protein